jgi:hypothetical protein
MAATIMLYTYRFLTISLRELTVLAITAAIENG